MKLRKKIQNSAILLIMALLVVACGGAEQRKDKYLKRGNEYLEQQNYDKAIVELKNVLQIDPKHAEAYYLIGTAEERKSNWRAAFGNYNKAAQLNPDHIAAQTSVGRFYLLSGDTAKAEEIAATILSKKPDDPEGKTLRAAILNAKKDVNGAIKLAQEVIAADPTQIPTIVFLADIYWQQNQQAKAQEVLEKAVSANPKNSALRVKLSSIYYLLKNFDKAEEQLNELVGMDPANLPYQAALVNFYRQTKQLDKAETRIKELIKADPKDPQRHLLLAEFLANEKGTEQAEKQLLASINEQTKLYELRFSLATLYERSGKAVQAEEQYKKIIDGKGTEPLGLKAHSLLANSYLAQGKSVDEAEKLISTVLKENPKDNDALLLKGKLSLTKGNPQDAVTAFRAILKDQPNSLDVLILLGNAHMFGGEKELARESFRKAVESNPKDTKAHIALAQFLANTRDYKGAIKSLDEASKLDPKQIEIYIAKANIQLAIKDQRGAEKTLSAIKSSHPESPVGFFRMGQLYSDQKKYGEAIREFEQALKLSPASSEILTATVNADLTRNKPDMAIKRLNDILSKSSDNILARKLLADVYVRQKQHDKAEKELYRTIEINPKWSVSYLSLAAIFLDQKNPQAAINIIDQGLKAIPDDPSLMLSLASVHERNQAYAKAIDVYQRILGKSPDNAVAVNNLASLLVEHKSDKESLEQARTLALKLEKAPQPVFRDTLGWVYYKLGETDKAISLLEEVVKAAPAVPVFRYHLGMSYYKKGDLASAKIHLSKAVDVKSDYQGLDEAREVLKKLP